MQTTILSKIYYDDLQASLNAVKRKNCCNFVQVDPLAQLDWSIIDIFTFSSRGVESTDMAILINLILILSNPSVTKYLD